LDARAYVERAPTASRVGVTGPVGR